MHVMFYMQFYHWGGIGDAGKLQSINAARNPGAGQTLQKVSALFHLQQEDWLEVDFSRWGNRDSDNEKFELRKTAILRTNKIRISYASSYEEITERILQPHKLSYKSKAWDQSSFPKGNGIPGLR